VIVPNPVINIFHWVRILCIQHIRVYFQIIHEQKVLFFSKSYVLMTGLACMSSLLLMMHLTSWLHSLEVVIILIFPYTLITLRNEKFQGRLSSMLILVYDVNRNKTYAHYAVFIYFRKLVYIATKFLVTGLCFEGNYCLQFRVGKRDKQEAINCWILLTSFLLSIFFNPEDGTF
jgi:hypothetical protein